MIIGLLFLSRKLIYQQFSVQTFSLRITVLIGK